MTDPQFSSLVPNAELEAMQLVIAAARVIAAMKRTAPPFKWSQLNEALDALDKVREGAAVRRFPRSE